MQSNEDLIGLILLISNVSSVKVPVLSKQRTVSLAALFILLGEIQLILAASSLLIDKMILIDKQVGKAGGITIVIMLQERQNIYSASRSNSLSLNIVHIVPKIAIVSKTNKNFIASL